MVKKSFYMKHSLHLSLAIIAIFAMLTTSQASVAGDGNLAQKIDSTFKIMIADPSNVDITLKYANLVIEAKDYEAAIPPFERLLFFNPELHEIKLRLGIMYYNLESYSMAKTYFSEVIKGTKDKVLFSQAQEYLSKM